ncbi:MAG: hypothetical protein PVG87_17250, partial [Desulfobacteraceae bacterium]
CFSGTPWFAIWKRHDKISSTKEIILSADIKIWKTAPKIESGNGTPEHLTYFGDRPSCKSY